MKKTVLVFAALIFFITTNMFAQNSEQNQGREAPNFKLQNLNGNYVELNDFTGKGPVLLSFWATWCKPCLEELAEYKKLYKEYEPKGLKILAISTDNEKTVAKVKPFVRSKGFPFIILLDTNSDVARQYYANPIPYTVLIDDKGKIVYSHLGYMRGDELKVKAELDNLLKK